MDCPRCWSSNLHYEKEVTNLGEFRRKNFHKMICYLQTDNMYLQSKTFSFSALG